MSNLVMLGFDGIPTATMQVQIAGNAFTPPMRTLERFAESTWGC